MENKQLGNCYYVMRSINWSKAPVTNEDVAVDVAIIPTSSGVHVGFIRKDGMIIYPGKQDKLPCDSKVMAEYIIQLLQNGTHNMTIQVAGKHVSVVQCLERMVSLNREIIHVEKNQKASNLAMVQLCHRGIMSAEGQNIGISFAFYVFVPVSKGDLLVQINDVSNKAYIPLTGYQLAKVVMFDVTHNKLFEVVNFINRMKTVSNPQMCPIYIDEDHPDNLSFDLISNSHETQDMSTCYDTVAQNQNPDLVCEEQIDSDDELAPVSMKNNDADTPLQQNHDTHELFDITLLPCETNEQDGNDNLEQVDFDDVVKMEQSDFDELFDSTFTPSWENTPWLHYDWSNFN